MQPFSQGTITELQGMTTDMYTDNIEVNPMVEIDDGYGNTTEKYPHSSYVVKGSLQEVVRIPGTMCRRLALHWDHQRRDTALPAA